ncbi:hypothetical protein AVEN_238660-1 [Araneus ventricosus]|uniref:Uncharacterized protein n=1 Tax=Araneus ventricosus TaxID=182803 RepID=A0A4Y2Q8N4_ARAVE|nr:hypothetical protein AVEN_238660-1 [Araneus ventricosus]
MAPSEKGLHILFGNLEKRARPSPRVRSPTEDYYTTHGKEEECSFCWHQTLDARGKKSDFVHCLYALLGMMEWPSRLG